MRSLVRRKGKPKEMNNTMVSNKPSSKKKVKGKKVDLTGWDYVCTFGNNLVYAKGSKRRLIKANTGEIVFEYTIGIHEVKFDNKGNQG